jgi:hypothetical protein
MATLRIAVLYHCQAKGLARSLAALLPEAEVHALEMTEALKDIAIAKQHARLADEADFVVTADMPGHVKHLRNAGMTRAEDRLVRVPPITFGGFHPDDTEVPADMVPPNPPPVHSRIAIIGHLAGWTAEQTLGLYNALTFARLGYFDVFDAHRALLVERFGCYGIDLEPVFDGWVRQGLFMHNPVHPRPGPLLDLARMACGKMGLTPAEGVDAAGLFDTLAHFSRPPVFAEIAERLGVPAQPDVEILSSGPVPLPRLLEVSFEWLARVPRFVLRAVPGVAEGLVALELSAAEPKRMPAAALHPEARHFLSAHGSILRVERGSGVLVHAALTEGDEDATDLALVLTQGPDGIGRSPAMGGITVRAAQGSAGVVQIARQDRFMCADPRKKQIQFSRDEAGPWESFLPVRQDAMRVLRRILGSDCIVEGSERRIPQPLVRLAGPFRLAIGALLADLTAGMPVAEAAASEGEAERFRVETMHDGPVVIRCEAPAGPAGEFVLQRVETETFLDEAASPQDLLANRGRTLTVRRETEFFAMPNTVDDRDGRWMHDKHHTKQPPHYGALHTSLVVSRAPGLTVSLTRGTEGTLFDRNGCYKDYGYIFGKAMGPPKGVRLAEGRALGDPDAIAAAPLVEGPVAVFYNGNLQNYYHWLVEAVVPLFGMAPYLPREARLLLPPSISRFSRSGETSFDHMAMLHAMELVFATVEPDEALVRTEDLFWHPTFGMSHVPASLYREFAAEMARRFGAPRAMERLYIRRPHNRKVANADQVERFLASKGFAVVELENMPPVAQMKLFVDAEFVVSTHGAGMANLVFCRPGTKILELSPNIEFRPFFWQLSEKLRLPYMIVQSPTHGGFNGEMDVSMPRLRAAFRMLRAACV